MVGRGFKMMKVDLIKSLNKLKYNMCTIIYSQVLPNHYFEKQYYEALQKESQECERVEHNQLDVNGNKIDVISIPKFHSEQITTKNFFTLLQLCRDSSLSNSISLIGIDPYYHIRDKLFQKSIRINYFNNLQDNQSQNQNVVNKLIKLNLDFSLNNDNIQNWIDDILLDLKVFDKIKHSQLKKQFYSSKIVDFESNNKKIIDDYFSQIFQFENLNKIENIKQRQQELQKIILDKVTNKEDVETLEYPLLSKAIDFSLTLKKKIYLGELPKLIMKNFMLQHYSLQELEDILAKVLEQTHNQKQLSLVRQLSMKEFFYKNSHLNIIYLVFLTHQLIQQKQQPITVFIKNYQSLPYIQIMQFFSKNPHLCNKFIESFQLKQRYPLNKSDDNNNYLIKKKLILDLLYWDDTKHFR